MLAGAHRDTLLIQDGAGIMRMHTVEDERQHAGLVPRLANNPRPGNLPHLCGRILEHRVFVRQRRFAIDARQVINGGAQANDARHVGRARLELVRHLVVERLLERHRRNHVAATLIRRHCLQQRRAAIQHAGAGGAVHLVAREHVEVAVEIVHVDH